MMMNPFVNVLTIRAFLKRHGVKKIVMSSGTRNIPFCNLVANDEFFDCYSVIDERNAAFFALGLSQQSGEPVALTCTTGTAVSNYLSGMTEAFYSNVPLIAITFDRSPYVLHQLETQKIDQPAVLQSVTVKSVELPMLKDDDDLWYFERLCNEAFIAMKKSRKPIQINVPIVGTTNFFYQKDISVFDEPPIKFIDHIQPTDDWTEKIAALNRSKKILLVIGQNTFDDETKRAIAEFCRKYKCPVLADHLANFQCEEFIPAEAVIKSLKSKTLEKFVPDILISFGANFQGRIKDIFRAHRGSFEHWSIDPEGIIKDVFKAQTALFECEPRYFFEQFNDGSDADDSYLNQWKKLVNAIELPDMPFTNFYAVREFCKVIPKDSILHLSILNNTRLGQFFPLDPSIRVYSNVNAFGIDGCLPTFMGQAAATDKLAFLLIGDLSFFYSMNAISIKHRKGNVRIMVINNGGGAEFHIMPTATEIPTLDFHTGVAHNRTAKGWAEASNYKYLAADDEQSLSKALKTFVEPGEQPILLEVFTNMARDGEFCLQVYRHIEQCIRPLIEEE